MNTIVASARKMLHVRLFQDWHRTEPNNRVPQWTTQTTQNTGCRRYDKSGTNFTGVEMTKQRQLVQLSLSQRQKFSFREIYSQLNYYSCIFYVYLSTLVNSCKSSECSELVVRYWYNSNRVILAYIHIRLLHRMTERICRKSKYK